MPDITLPNGSVRRVPNVGVDMRDERKGSPTEAQRAFATCKEPFPALVAGYGSGKTAAGIARAMMLKILCRHQNIAYYLPTYPLVEDIAFERFPELCTRKGWDFKLRKTGGSPHIEFPGAGRILFRTMEHPDRIVGYEVAHSIVDELDILSIDKAEKAWNKIIARNRQKCGMPNTVGVVTTPEGFRFVYKKWVKDVKRGYVKFHARTQDNAHNLPEDYIPNLIATYPEQLLKAYLEGQFVNLTSGTVYHNFNRISCFTNAVPQKGEALHIGMDFNVMKMAAIIHVMRNGRPHAVGELTKVFDTPEMIRMIKERFPMHHITVYPDASGKNRKSSNASESDIALLQQARFTVLHPDSNPLVKDRVLAMNKAFGGKDPFYRVNPDLCPTYVEGLEQQAYDKNGEPDKETGWDHTNDAGGYFISYRWPVVKPAMSINLGVASNG